MSIPPKIGVSRDHFTRPKTCLEMPLARAVAVAGFTVNLDKLGEAPDRNPILVTALNPVIGYEKGAAVAKKAYAEGRPVREVAAEMTDLTDDELDRLLNAAELTKGGIKA